MGYLTERPVETRYEQTSGLQGHKQTPKQVDESVKSKASGNALHPKQIGHPEYYNHHDLNAQKNMAESTEAIVLWTKISIALAAVGAILIWLTLGETRRAVDVTRETGRDQSRAYVDVNSAEIYWRTADMTHPYIHLEFRNSGQTPARWFEFTALCFLREYDSPHIERNDSISAPPTPERWNALAGNSSLTAAIKSENTVEIIIQANKSRETHFIEVAGVVAYETFFGEIFETEFRFMAKSLRAYKHEESRRIKGTDHLEVDDPLRGFNDDLTTVEWQEIPIKMGRSNGAMDTYRYVRQANHKA